MLFRSEQDLISYDDVISIMNEYAVEKPELLHGSFLLNKVVGKINNSVLNKICANMMLANDNTIRKQSMQQLMKIIQRVVK